MEGDNEESVFFRQNLIKLHNQLEICKVPTAANCISFKSINYRENTNTIFNKEYRRHRLKIEFITPVAPQFNKIKIDILNRTNINILPYQHTKYKLEHFKANGDFINLSDSLKEVIIEGFESLNPKLKESLIASKKSDSLTTIKDVLFIKDTNLLSQGIIEILYNLRCILFHGEIPPNRDNLNLYEPAYYMLRLLIKSLN